MLQATARGADSLAVRPLQDSTTRIWDVRYLRSSVATLKAHMGAVRSLRFSPDGSVLAAAEPADFVDLFDVASNYESRQTVRLLNPNSGCTN